MDDLKLMTVRALRELAKSHLGAGFSRLKTKAEIIAALTKQLAVDARAIISDPHPAPAAPPEPVQVETPAGPPVESSPVARDSAAAVPALAKNRDGASAPESEATEAEAEAEALEDPAVAPAPVLVAAADEVEGELAPTDAALEEPEAELELEEPAKVVPPPPRVMSQAEIDLINENLGDLPVGYHDDSVSLLPRDPHTLWVCWDFSQQTARQAREALPGARAVIRLFDGGHLVREVDVALESRSWYLHHVTPGRRYRAELVFVAGSQSARRLGPSSNATLVPGEGPSPIVDDKFIALPYEIPLARSAEVLEHAKPGAPFPRASQDALLARAEGGLQVEGLRDEAPPVGETVEIYHQLVRGLGGSETMVEVMKRRTRFGGLWTSSRPASAWTSSKPG
jgi:hypothetical protein